MKGVQETQLSPRLLSLVAVCVFIMFSHDRLQEHRVVSQSLCVPSWYSFIG